MEIDFGQKLKDLDGVEMKDGKGVDYTLSKVCVEALLSQGDPQAKIGGPEKMKRYSLAQKIHNGKNPIRVDAEDITLLKKLIGEIFLPLAVGQAYEMLEGAKPGK